MTEEDFKDIEDREAVLHDDKVMNIGKENEYMKKIIEARGKFIDWVIFNHPAVVKEYLGWTE